MNEDMPWLQSMAGRLVVEANLSPQHAQNVAMQIGNTVNHLRSQEVARNPDFRNSAKGEEFVYRNVMGSGNGTPLRDNTAAQKIVWEAIYLNTDREVAERRTPANPAPQANQTPQDIALQAAARMLGGR